MAPILLRAVNTADCGFNRAALRPAYPIKRPRARREHRHPKASKPGKSLPAICDRLTRADSTRTGVASGRTGEWAKAAVPWRAGNSLLRPPMTFVADQSHAGVPSPK